MNQHLAFMPPKIDYQRRNYEPYVQQFLELMLHRTPKDRASIQMICNFSPIKKSTMYSQLMDEDQLFR